MRVQIGKEYHLVSHGEYHEEERMTVKSVRIIGETAFEQSDFEENDLDNKKLYIAEGNGSISHKYISMNFGWLQDDPLIMQEKYRKALKYFKKTGHGRIRQLSEEFRKRLKKHSTHKKVLLLYIEQLSDNHYVATYVEQSGLQYSADIRWFEDISNKDIEKYTMERYFKIKD